MCSVDQEERRGGGLTLPQPKLAANDADFRNPLVHTMKYL
jgi:hypothetical protein